MRKVLISQLRAGGRAPRFAGDLDAGALPKLGLDNLPRRTNQDVRAAIVAIVTAREHALGETESSARSSSPKSHVTSAGISAESAPDSASCCKRPC